VKQKEQISLWNDDIDFEEAPRKMGAGRLKTPGFLNRGKKDPNGDSRSWEKNQLGGERRTFPAVAFGEGGELSPS